MRDRDDDQEVFIIRFYFRIQFNIRSGGCVYGPAADCQHGRSHVAVEYHAECGIAGQFGCGEWQ